MPKIVLSLRAGGTWKLSSGCAIGLENAPAAPKGLTELLDPAEDVEEGAAQRLSELAVPAEPAEKQKPASEKN